MEQIPKPSPKSNKDYLGEGIEDILKDVPDFSQDKKKHDDTPKASPEEIEEAKRKTQEAIDKHNQEIRDRKEKTTPTNGEKSPEDIFESHQNVEKFNSLSSKIKNKIIDLYKEVKFNFIDRRKIMKSDKLQKHYQKSLDQKLNDLTIKERLSENIQTEINELNARVKSLKDQLGELNPTAQKEADNEKKKLEKTLTKSKGEEFEMKLELADMEAKRNKFENRKNELTQKAKEFIKEKTDPYNKKIEDLSEDKSELYSKAMNLSEKINSGEEKLRYFEGKIQDSKFRFEKTAYKNKIKEIKTIIKEQRKSMYLLQGEYENITEKIQGLQYRVDYWNNMYKEINLIKDVEERTKQNKEHGEQEYIKDESIKVKKQA